MRISKEIGKTGLVQCLQEQNFAGSDPEIWEKVGADLKSLTPNTVIKA